MYFERFIEAQENGRILIGRLNNYSMGAAQGSHESAISLLHTLVPKGQDDGPDIPITLDIMQVLDKREKFAVEVARHYAEEFNRDFGYASRAGALLTWDIDYMRWFFERFGKAVHGMLNPQGPYGKRVVNNLILTTQHYYELTSLAELRLNPRVRK